ncbi:MAG: hypothetical protein ACOH1R_11625, partial [Luteimonas sp.]
VGELAQHAERLVEGDEHGGPELGDSKLEHAGMEHAGMEHAGMDTSDAMVGAAAIRSGNRRLAC